MTACLKSEYKFMKTTLYGPSLMHLSVMVNAIIFVDTVNKETIGYCRVMDTGTVTGLDMACVNGCAEFDTCHVVVVDVVMTRDDIYACRTRRMKGKGLRNFRTGGELAVRSAWRRLMTTASTQQSNVTIGMMFIQRRPADRRHIVTGTASIGAVDPLRQCMMDCVGGTLNHDQQLYMFANFIAKRQTSSPRVCFQSNGISLRHAAERQGVRSGYASWQTQQFLVNCLPNISQVRLKDVEVRNKNWRSLLAMEFVSDEGARHMFLNSVPYESIAEAISSSIATFRFEIARISVFGRSIGTTKTTETTSLAYGTPDAGVYSLDDDHLRFISHHDLADPSISSFVDAMREKGLIRVLYHCKDQVHILWNAVRVDGSLYTDRFDVTRVNMDANGTILHRSCTCSMNDASNCPHTLALARVISVIQLGSEGDDPHSIAAII